MAKKLDALQSAMNYWQHRINHKIYDSNVPKVQKQVKRLYQMAFRGISKDLEGLYLQMMEMDEISANTLYRVERYKTLKVKIAGEINKLGRAEEKLIGNSIGKAYRTSYKETAKMMDPNFSWTILNEHNAKQILIADFKGANFSDRIWLNKSKLSQRLEKALVETVVSGNSKDRAVIEFQKRFNVGFREADRIIRTEVQRALNEGQRQTYRDRGYTELNWIVADDDRLCEECSAMPEGNPYNIDEVPAVLHPNCRCTVIPVLQPLE